MRGLRELQEGFAATVLDRADPALLGNELWPQGPGLARRITVYRVNARENFAAALEAAFPVLQLELGPERFRGLARSYQQAHPSPAGNLFEIGRRLPGFLGAELAGHPDQYLADLARLEWAVQEAMVAGDCTGRIDFAALGALPAQRHAELRFQLHPSTRLLVTAWPVFGHWERFHARPQESRVSPGRPAAGSEHLLVHRAGTGVEVARLAPVDHRLLGLASGGATLGDLVAAAIGLSPATDTGAVLARWAAAGVITGATDNAGD